MFYLFDMTHSLLRKPIDVFYIQSSDFWSLPTGAAGKAAELEKTDNLEKKTDSRPPNSREWFHDGKNEVGILSRPSKTHDKKVFSRAPWETYDKKQKYRNRNSHAKTIKFTWSSFM